MSISSSYRYHADINPAALKQVRSLLTKVFCLALFGYAVLPSVVSVVASRFDDAYLILSLAVTISSIIDPIIRLVAGMDRFRHIKKSFVDLCFTAFIASSVFMIGLVGIRNGSSFASSSLMAMIPVSMYIISLGLFNFLNSLIMLKVHAATSLETLHESRSTDTNRCTSGIDNELDGQFTSDAFRWVGCTNQTGMTCGSILVTCLLFSGLLAASDVAEDE